MGSRHNPSGPCPRAFRHPSLQRPQTNKTTTKISIRYVRRGGRLIKKVCSSSRPSRPGTGRLLLNLLHCVKKGRGFTPYPKPQTIQRLGQETTVQNGDSQFDIRSHLPGTVDGISRPKGCLFPCADLKRPPQIPAISVAGNGVPIQVTTVRSIIGTPGIHQGAPTAHSLPQNPGCYNICIPGRHPCRWMVTGGGTGSGGTHSQRFDPGRVYHKSDQVRTATNPGPYLHRGKAPHRFGNGILAPSTQGSPPSLRPDLSQGGAIQASAPIPAHSGTHGCMHQRGQTCPTIHAPNTVARQGQMVLSPGSQCNHHGDRLSGQQPAVVAPRAEPPEGHKAPASQPRPNRNNGFQHARLGRLSPRRSIATDSASRFLVPTGAEASYQSLGAQSSETNPERAGTTYPSQVNTHRVGQFHDRGLYKQTGRSPLSLSQQGSQTSVRLGDPKRDHSPCHSSSRSRQYFSRLPQPTQSGFHRVDSPPASRGSIVQDLGYPPDRPVCNQRQCETTSVLLKDSRPSRDPAGCIPTELGTLGNLCLSPHSPVTQSPDQDSDGPGINHSDSPHVAQTPLVPPTTPPLLGRAQGPPTGPQTPVSGATGGGNIVPLRHNDPQVGSLEAERGQLQDQGFSEPAIAIMLAARRSSTRKVYDSRWDAFCGWCRTRDVNPATAPVNRVIDFLTSMVDTKAVNTLKGYVTAISARHAPIGDQPLSLHPSIVLWVRGLLKKIGLPRVLIPPWNLEIILQALKKWPFEPINAASRKFLTWKAAFLVAITSARRASELHALRCDPPYVSFGSEDVTLYPDVGFQSKVNTPFHAAQALCLPSLYREKGDIRLLCVRRILKIYIERTRHFRAPNTRQLFVAYGGNDKGHPITKQRLSAWLVELIHFVYDQNDLPIPQGVKGHQTRKQATSLADMAGVDPQAICDAATWASRCTFAHHYRLNMVAQVRSNFGRTILKVAGASNPETTTGQAAPKRQ